MTTSQVSSHRSDNLALRHLFVRNLIGRPYELNARGPEKFDCWHLAVYVQYHLFGRNAPNIEVPEKVNWRWMIEQFTTHPELENWCETLMPNNGLITAQDGSVVLMGRTLRPAHCGVFFKDERSILHADEGLGVVFEEIPIVKANGWSRLAFYGPK